MSKKNQKLVTPAILRQAVIGVGLSMMCYRLREANKTCLGERQERGRMGKLL